jgi:uncharacterized membrane protein
LTSLVFILLVGIFVSSWVGSTVFWVGEWFIKKMPFVRHIYSASKQVSTAVSPGNVISTQLHSTCTRMLNVHIISSNFILAFL